MASREDIKASLAVARIYFLENPKTGRDWEENCISRFGLRSLEVCIGGIVKDFWAPLLYRMKIEECYRIKTETIYATLSRFYR